MSKINKLIAVLFAAAVASSSVSYASNNYSYQTTVPQYMYNNVNSNVQQPVTYNNEPLKGSIVTVPAGEAFPALIPNELSSKYLKTGDTVNLVLNNDYYFNEKLIAPVGSTVTGSVIEARKAKRGNINGKLCVRFTQITTPLGVNIPISAVIKTNDSSGVLVGGTKKDVAVDYTKDFVAGSAAGALSGVVFGALAGGHVGRGAALGTAVGAGGGLIKSVMSTGDDVVIPANSSVELMLTEPITATISNYSFEN